MLDESNTSPGEAVPHRAPECEPHVHQRLAEVTELLDTAWKTEFIPLKVSYQAWSRIEPIFRTFPDFYRIAQRWATDSILIRARGMTDFANARGPKPNPMSALELVAQQLPSLTIEQLVAHQSCRIREPAAPWVRDEYVKYLQSCGLFSSTSTLDAEALRFQIRSLGESQQHLRTFVSRHVAHQIGMEEPPPPLTQAEFGQFLDTIGDALQTLHLVLDFTGTSDDVANIGPEAEVIDALRVWDREAFYEARRAFLISRGFTGERNSVDDFFSAICATYSLSRSGRLPAAGRDE